MTKVLYVECFYVGLVELGKRRSEEMNVIQDLVKCFSVVFVLFLFLFETEIMLKILMLF